MDENIIGELAGENIPSDVVSLIRNDKSLMRIIGKDEIEAAGSLEAAIANTFSLTWDEKCVKVFDLEGRHRKTLTRG